MLQDLGVEFAEYLSRKLNKKFECQEIRRIFGGASSAQGDAWHLPGDRGNTTPEDVQAYERFIAYWRYREGDRGNTTPGQVPWESVFYDNEGYDSGETDSDTISSLGMQYDKSDIAHLPEEEQEQEIYWQYQYAKGKWRQSQRKPVRRVRRFFRKKFALSLIHI